MTRARILLAFALLAGPAMALNAPSGAPSAAAPSAAASPTAVAAPSAAPPAAVPPAAVPSAAASAPTSGGAPHPVAGHGSDISARDRFAELQDRSVADPSLPPGTLEVLVVDDNNVPIANQALQLEVLKASIATGDVKESRSAMTSPTGVARFEGESTTTDFSYRVLVQRGPATFATGSFPLQLAVGQRVLLHVFPVIRDLTGAVIVMAEQISVEPKGARFRISATLEIQNYGRTALVPENLSIALPVGAEAFTGSTDETDRKLEQAGNSALVRGTFPPGTHRLGYSFDVRSSGSETQILLLGLPPNLRSAVLVVEASPKMTLSAPQLGETLERQHATGQRVLIASRDYLARRERNPSTLRATLGGMPVPSPARTIASGIAALIVLWGLYRLGSAKRGPGGWRGVAAPDLTRARDLLLDELVALEAAYAGEKIGPRTYERAKATLLDSLGRLLAQPNSGSR